LTSLGAWDYHSLPAVNATLNGTAAALLIYGYTCIRQKNVTAHHRTMIAAFSISILFLISYLTYHWLLISHGEGTLHYPHAGALRTVYLTILLTHTVLAAIVPVLAIVTLRRGFKAMNPQAATDDRPRWFAKHRAIAKWTLPIWLYVSITGVVVYFMLYHA